MKIKRGMGGSRNGKSRREPTGVLKKESKKRRRKQSTAEANLAREAVAWERAELYGCGLIE